MTTELLEIQPRELKFIFELKKQSSCSVRLVNNFHHYVAFKVKTTCPKKYSVRPNIGIIKPKSTSDFIVTMQAQRLAPPDMICKDKFLIQSTVVPIGTTDKDITPSMFAKDDGKYIEENKLRVILVSPPHSPVLSPIGGVLKQGPAYETSIFKDQLLNRVEIPIPRHTDAKDFEELKIINGEELKPAKNVELKRMEDVEEPKIVNCEELKPAKNVELKKMEVVEEPKIVNCEELKPAKNVELKTIEDVEELKLVKDIEEMKSKLNELESKLHEAEVTISKQTQERKLTMQEREILQQELAMLRRKGGVRKVHVGFPFLFVCMVALISVTLGYLLHP